MPTAPPPRGRTPWAPKAPTALQGPQGEQLDQQLFDAYYLAFEDACRGSEAQIRQHLNHYQPQWKPPAKQAPVPWM